MNKQNLVCLFLISFFVLACGLFGASKITVKAGEFSAEMEEKSSAVIIRNESSEAEFVIANYDLDLSGKSLQSAQKLNSPKQVRVSFGVKGNKNDLVDRGKPRDYKGAEIKWVDIYYFEGGQEKVSRIETPRGNILIGTVRENDVIGGIYVYDGEHAVRGTFTAKKIQ